MKKLYSTILPIVMILYLAMLSSCSGNSDETENGGTDDGILRITADKTAIQADIVYLESERKHMHLVMTDGTSREYVGKIKEEINNLPEYFVQIGQSYIVNYRHIRECRSEYVIMDNGTKLSISRGYKADVTDKILKLGV